MFGRKKRNDAATPKTDGGPARPWRVLIAGDTPDSVELLARLLAEAGHELAVADDRGSVLRALAEHRTSCLVLDVVGNGNAQAMRVLESVRHDPDGRVADVAVVWCGNAATPVNEAWSRGADEVLVRPVAEGELARAVESAVRRPTDDRVAYRVARLGPSVDEVG